MRVLLFTALAVATLFLSARLLHPWLHLFAWPYFLSATTLAPLVSASVETNVPRNFAIKVLASYDIFGIAGISSAALLLILWESRLEPPLIPLLEPHHAWTVSPLEPLFLLVITNLLVWPPGARLLLRTTWPVGISLGVVVAFVLPVLMAVGWVTAVIAGLAGRPT